MTRLRDLVRGERKPAIQLPEWLDRLISIGIVSTDALVIERQRCVNVAAFAVAATALSHLIINAVHDFRGLILVNADNMFMLTVSLLVPRLHRLGDHAGGIALVLAVLFGQMLIVWSLGLASALHIYYTLGGAMLFFFGVENWRLFLGLFGLYVLALVLALNLAPVAGLVMPDDQAFRDMLSSQAMINTAAIIAALIFYALWDRDRAENRAARRACALRGSARHAHAAGDRGAPEVGTRSAHRRQDRHAQRHVRGPHGLHGGGARPFPRGGRGLSRPAGARAR